MRLGGVGVQEFRMGDKSEGRGGRSRSGVFRSAGRVQLKRDGTRAKKNNFRLSAKRRSLFKSTGGRQFSRLLAAEVGTSAVVMLDIPCSEVV